MGDHVSPWIPMDDPVDIKHIGKLLEELAEASKIASRCLIQGINECDPKTGEVNLHALQDELADVLANIELVVERFGLNEYQMNGRKYEKQEMLRRWHVMSSIRPVPAAVPFDDSDIPF
jgi:hypothetical protein